MRLLITTPTELVIDVPDATAIRAEDDSGSFGILDGHANFLTALTVTVVRWTRTDGRKQFCAVRRGVMSVTNGSEATIATREAVPGDSLDHLEEVVLTTFRDTLEAEKQARSEGLQLQMKAIRQIVSYLRPDLRNILGDGV